MPLSLSAGEKAPNQINVIIEISANSGPVKYEYDKDTKMLCVDRFLHTSMVYPCNYGFIPKTIAGDGDPVDVLVYSTMPIIAGAYIKVRPIGVLLSEDESGNDAKIIAVPIEKVDPFLKNIKNYTDLPHLFLEQVKHFFERYKDLEADKWVKVTGWKDAATAYDIISKSIQDYKE